MFSAPPDGSGDDGEGVDPEEFQEYFIDPGPLHRGHRDPVRAVDDHRRARVFQHLAEGFPVGMRFHSAPVVRLADAKPVHLGHVAGADGAWRLYVFADRNDPTGADSELRQLCAFLASDASPITRFTPAGADPDSVIDVRAVFQQGHRDLAVDAMPPVLLPRKGDFGLVDYEKVFCPDPNAGDVFDLRGVNRDTGCMVVVRPDQYVANVLPLHGHEALTELPRGDPGRGRLAPAVGGGAARGLARVALQQRCACAAARRPTARRRWSTARSTASGSSASRASWRSSCDEAASLQSTSDDPVVA